MAQGQEKGKRDDVPDASSPLGLFRRLLYTVIFEADTFSGRAFDFVLIWAILSSVAVAMLESVPSLKAGNLEAFHRLEWFFTLLFTAEYALRIFCHRHPLRYVFSFFGIVDLLSILPTYLSLVFPGTQALVVIRVFRTLRLFRVFKLVRYMREARVLLVALQGARPKIVVFLVAVCGIVISMGAVMYLVEGGESGFSSIPKSIYWAVVTLTTVGYGDMSPKTPWGQAIASVVMIIGYSIIAVPTGIFTMEIAQAARRMANPSACPQCAMTGHDSDAKYCKNCGGWLSHEAETAIQP